MAPTVNVNARLLVSLFLSVAVAVAVAGCGGGGGDSAAPAAPAPVPPLAQTVVDISGTAAPVGIDYWGDKSAVNGGKGETIDGVPCRQMDETFHVHSHLAIVLNGQLLTIPSQLGQITASGSTAGCFYQIHNHDKAGRLHVEAPAPVNYALGSFFKIWGQPLARDNVGGITGLPIVFYVTDNGVVTRYDGDPAAIELKSHRLITIQIGSPLPAIPHFTWTGT